MGGGNPRYAPAGPTWRRIEFPCGERTMGIALGVLRTVGGRKSSPSVVASDRDGPQSRELAKVWRLLSRPSRRGCEQELGATRQSNHALRIRRHAYPLIFIDASASPTTGGIRAFGGWPHFGRWFSERAFGNLGPPENQTTPPANDDMQIH